MQGWSQLRGAVCPEFSPRCRSKSHSAEDARASWAGRGREGNMFGEQQALFQGLGAWGELS